VNSSHQWSELDYLLAATSVAECYISTALVLKAYCFFAVFLHFADIPFIGDFYYLLLMNFSACRLICSIFTEGLVDCHNETYSFKDAQLHDVFIWQWYFIDLLLLFYC
jgi:hypothetical protein